MSANLDKFKPVTHLVFTTNALRNNNGDGTLNYYKRYESSYSNPIKKDEPFSANYPEFFYHGEITIRYVDTQDEVINKAKSTLSNLAITQRKKFYLEEIILLLNCDSDGEFVVNVIYYDIYTRKWDMELFADLAEDSELTEKQVKHIMNKLIDFYRAKADTPKAKISELQKEYLD